ncbi:MAG TPA: CapA family protein, partial [Jatrophihabitantaceae bacterium]|nr:CapA family protein [Jatrophihabitantaceae bacterium]
MNRRPIAALVVGAVGAVLLAGCDGHHDARPAPTLHVTVTHTVTPSTTQPAQPSQLRTVTVIGSGDVLIHPPVWEQAAADAHVEGRTGYDFGPIYASVAPTTRAADLAICEMETPLAPSNGPFQGYP